MGRFEKGKIVPQQQRDGIILAHPEVGKPGGRPAPTRQKLGLRADAFADNYGRDIVVHRSSCPRVFANLTSI